ncbi:MAG: hypothetical protein H6735_19190 [Alphaproteobacteria bacterium]|nr:hypothetical protein [Alphaproteobacteria bacterium]
MRDEVPFLPTPLQGWLYEQILSEAQPSGEFGRETSPFVILKLMDVPVANAYPGFFTEPDLCWRSFPDLKIRGERDVGKSVSLVVGGDELPLHRTTHFTPGETLYLYDPWDNDIDLGRRTGAELVLEGTSTGVEVPPVLDWSGSAWDAFFHSGVLDLHRVPSDRGTYVWLDLWLFDVNYNKTEVLCTLRDDGAAVVDPGYPLEELQAAELFLERIAPRVVEHPQFGPLMVQAYRNIHLQQDHLIQ